MTDVHTDTTLALVGKGALHAADAVKLARAARNCGASTSDVVSMSAMRTRHAERDLHRKFKCNGLSIDPYMLKLLCDDGTIVDVAALNIYEVFHAMCSNDVRAMKSFIGPRGMDGVSEFWSAAANSPVYQGHPIYDTPELLHKTVPLLLFYDGADVYRDQEYLWFLAYSALTSGDVLDTIMPILAIPARRVMKHETQRKLSWEVSRWIQWNCSILMFGQGTELGFYSEQLNRGSSQARLAGECLAGGLRATFAGTTGDYKARQEWNGFTQYYRATLLCESCEARQPTTPANACWTYGDFRHRAAWACTIIDTATHMKRSPVISPLTLITQYTWALDGIYAAAPSSACSLCLCWARVHQMSNWGACTKNSTAGASATGSTSRRETGYPCGRLVELTLPMHTQS